MSAEPPTKHLFKTINIMKVYGRGQEERRELQGPADPGSSIPATRPDLQGSSHLREPDHPSQSGAAKGELPSASFLLVPLSKGAKSRSAAASTHPPAGAHPRGHSPRPRGSTDAHAAALSASPAAEPLARALPRWPSAWASPPLPHSCRLSPPWRKFPGRPPTMKTCVRQLGAEASLQGERQTRSGGSGRELHRS